MKDVIERAIKAIDAIPTMNGAVDALDVVEDFVPVRQELQQLLSQIENAEPVGYRHSYEHSDGKSYHTLSDSKDARLKRSMKWLGTESLYTCPTPAYRELSNAEWEMVSQYRKAAALLEKNQ